MPLSVVILLFTTAVLFFLIALIGLGWLRLYSMSIGVALLFAGLFCWGLMRLPYFDNDNLTGVLIALFVFASAAAWGIAVIGDPAWNSWFNFFAAAFAAIAGGYATPDQVLPNALKSFDDLLLLLEGWLGSMS